MPNDTASMKCCDYINIIMVFTGHPPYEMLNGVSIVSAEHKSIDHNKIRLAPTLALMMPAGTCVTTYPQKKLLNTNAFVFSFQS